MEKLEFDNLIEEYNEVIKKYSPEELKKIGEQNKTIDIDITRIEGEIENIDLRISEMRNELDDIDKSPLALEYPDQIDSMKEDKRNQIEANETIKREKEEKIQTLKEKKEKNNKIIEEVTNIADKVIEKATDRVEEENNKLQEEIEELEEKKKAFGLKRKDKDGNETIQYTQEEKAILEGLDKKIKKLNRDINKNKINLKLFINSIKEKEKAREPIETVKEKKEEQQSAEVTTEEEQQEKPITVEEFMQDLLKVQQTKTPREFDELLAVLSKKYANVSKTFEDRLYEVLSKQKQKIIDGMKAQKKERKEAGETTREGEGAGETTREGEGAGEATREGEGAGETTREGDGAGEATRESEGAGETSRESEGAGETSRESEGKITVSRIEIEEATGQFKAFDESGNVIYDKQFEYNIETGDFELAKEYDYDIDLEEYTKFKEKVQEVEDSLKEEYGEEEFNEKFKNIDSRIYDFIIDLKDPEMLENYIRSIFDRDETMPFEVEYNLKDMYNTEMSLEEIDGIQKFSKIARKQNRERVEVKKDNIFKRAFGRFKKEIKERIDRKLLTSGEGSLSKEEAKAQRKKDKEAKKEQKQTEKDMKKLFGDDWQQKAEEYESRYGKDWKKYMDHMIEKHGKDWEEKTRTSSEYKKATRQTDEVSRQGQKQFEEYLRNGGEEPLSIDHEAAMERTSEDEPIELNTEAREPGDE